MTKAMKITFAKLRRTCPQCQSQSIKRSLRRGFVEKVFFRILCVWPFTCHNCDARFWDFSYHAAIDDLNPAIERVITSPKHLGRMSCDDRMHYESLYRTIFLFIAIAIVGMISQLGIRNAVAMHYANSGTLMGYERATRLEPENARNWYLLARSLEFDPPETTDPKYALQAYQTALSLDPHSTGTSLDMASLLEASDPSATRNAFLHAQWTYPASPEVAWRYEIVRFKCLS